MGLLSFEQAIVAGMTVCQMLSFLVSIIIVRDVPKAVIAEEEHEGGDVKSVRKDVTRLGAMVLIPINLVVFIITEGILMQSWNPVRIVQCLIRLDFSNRMFFYLPAALLIQIVIAAVAGMVARWWFFSEWEGLARATSGALGLCCAIGFVMPCVSCYAGVKSTTNITITEVCRKQTVFEETESNRTTGFDEEASDAQFEDYSESGVNDKAKENAESGENLPVGLEGEREIIADEEDAEEFTFVTLHNYGVVACEFETVYLSDDENQLKKSVFHDIVVPAGGEYTIQMHYGIGLQLHSGSSTVVYLTGEVGELLDQVTVPVLEDETVYRKGKGDEWGIYALNGEDGGRLAGDGGLAAPRFSKESGFYDEAFELTLAAEPGVSVYYTLDCSNPSTQSQRYQSPIHVYDKSSEENVFRNIKNVKRRWRDGVSDVAPVEKAFIVRAVAVDRNGNRSDTVTKSYFIGRDNYKDKPVISLVADPDALFNENDGIYVTGKEYDDWDEKDREEKTKEDYEDGTAYYYAGPTPNFYKRGEVWERVADALYLQNGTVSFQQLVGIRIQGGSNRDGQLKRFSLYSRKKYSGSKWFDYDIWGTKKNTHSLVLREGFLNAFTPFLVEDRDVAIERATPVSLFLNGEYCRDIYLCEKFTPPYFSEYYGVAQENVIMAKGAAIDGPVDTSGKSYTELYEFLENNTLSEEENYQQFGEMVDIQSFIDYSCINVYLGNMDNSETKNIVTWHTLYQEDKEFGDGRWRWTLHDMDMLTSSTRDAMDNPVDTDAQVNSFAIKGAYVDEAFNKRPLYMALKKNKVFRKQFVLTFMDLVNVNFNVDLVAKKLQEWGEDISYNDYFFRDRPQYITQYLAKEFNLAGTKEDVTLSASSGDAGSINLNTVKPDLSGGTWTGSYYTDYPVSVTAEPKEGYAFVRWEITDRNGTRTERSASCEVPVVEGGVKIHAVFNR